MARYDVEDFLADIETFLKNNLTAKLAAIDAEKADGITLATVATSGYYLQTLNEEVVNNNPFIFYGVDDIETQAHGPGVAEKITVGVILVLQDEAQDENIQRRMLRYLRALKEIFQDKWDKTNNRVKISVKGFPPTQFKDEVNSSNEARAVLVSITGSLPT